MRGSGCHNSGLKPSAFGQAFDALCKKISWQMTDELTAIADEMSALLPLFVSSNISGLILPTEHSSTFKALAVEAKSILDEELRHANQFSMSLLNVVNSGAASFTDGPSYASVEEASKIIHAAVRVIKRKRLRPPAAPAITKPYVDPTRLAAIPAIVNERWDFTRLVELCREINVASNNRCHMSTAMILRSILNHVPPIFGFKTFAEVANNYGGTRSQKSFKAAMQRLEGSLRSIADMQLHSPIRPREDIPTSVQVDFSAELDVLIGEVIRVAKTEQT